MNFSFPTRGKLIIGAAVLALGALGISWVADNLETFDTRTLDYVSPGQNVFSVPTPLGWWTKEVTPNTFIQFRLDKPKSCSVAEFIRKKKPDTIQIHFCANDSERTQQFNKLSAIFPWYLGYRASIKSQPELILQSKTDSKLGVLPPLVITNRSLTSDEHGKLSQVLCGTSACQ